MPQLTRLNILQARQIMSKGSVNPQELQFLLTYVYRSIEDIHYAQVHPERLLAQIVPEHCTEQTFNEDTTDMKFGW